VTEKSRDPFAFVTRGDRISFKLRLATNLKVHGLSKSRLKQYL